MYEAAGFDINTLSYAERTKKYKEFGITKSDGTEITEQDIEQNPTFYQNNTNQSTEKYITSEKTIRDLAARMSDRIGIPVRFESDRTKEYKGKLENGTAVVNLAYATLDTPIHEILGHPIIRAIKNKNINLIDFDNSKYKDATIKRNSKTNRFDIISKEGEQLESYPSLEKANKYLKEHKEWNKPVSLYQNLLKELEYGKGKEVLDRIKRDYEYKKEVLKIVILGMVIQLKLQKVKL